MIRFCFGAAVGCVVGFLIGWIACSMIRVNPPEHEPDQPERPKAA